MRLEQSLILNRYFHNLFGARSFRDPKQSSNVQEGSAGDGQTYFCGALLGRIRDIQLREKLPEYDARIIGYESRLGKACGSFSFNYQYRLTTFTLIEHYEFLLYCFS